MEEETPSINVIEENNNAFQKYNELRRLITEYSMNDTPFWEETFVTQEGRLPTGREKVEIRSKSKKCTIIKNPEYKKQEYGNDLKELANCNSKCHICEKNIKKGEDEVSGFFCKNERPQWVHSSCV